MMGLTVLEESDVSPVACFSKSGDSITHNAIETVTTLYIRLHALPLEPQKALYNTFYICSSIPTPTNTLGP